MSNFASSMTVVRSSKPSKVTNTIPASLSSRGLVVRGSRPSTGADSDDEDPGYQSILGDNDSDDEFEEAFEEGSDSGSDESDSDEENDEFADFFEGTSPKKTKKATKSKAKAPKPVYSQIPVPVQQYQQAPAPLQPVYRSYQQAPTPVQPLYPQNPAPQPVYQQASAPVQQYRPTPIQQAPVPTQQYQQAPVPTQQYQQAPTQQYQSSIPPIAPMHQQAPNNGYAQEQYYQAYQEPIYTQGLNEPMSFFNEREAIGRKIQEKFPNLDGPTVVTLSELIFNYVHYRVVYDMSLHDTVLAVIDRISQ